jgi:hypothetical protein
MRRKKRAESRSKALDALRAETEHDLAEQIRRLLALPMNERTHFLRKRVGIGASSL